jgi:uncharacterized protein (TIGR02145 family)
MNYLNLTKLFLIIILFHSNVLFGQTTFSFTGNGLWTTPSNWQNNLMPPDTIRGNSTINISPITDGNCILNKIQVITNGANINLDINAKIIVQGNLTINNTALASITICNQIWSVKNLDVTHYRNGDSIPQVSNPNEWGSLTTGAWCYFNNDSSNNATYGKLYNWYAVNDPRGLAPIGWHIPTNTEWTYLIDTCLGGSSIAGGKMKTTGTVQSGTGLWRSPNSGATNSSNFTALPGAFRDDVGGFGFGVPSYTAFWWSATDLGPSDPRWAWGRSLVYNGTSANLTGSLKTSGFSVRIIKD